MSQFSHPSQGVALSVLVMVLRVGLDYLFLLDGENRSLRSDSLDFAVVWTLLILLC